METVRKEINEFKLLLESVPATSMVLFVLSVVCMNIFAQKELLSTPYLSLDCGFTLSWISFMAMDMLTRRFGAKASIELSIFAEAINLFFSGLFFLLCLLPTNWGEFYATGNLSINEAINNTLGGTWYVVIGSTTAFIVSAIVNSLLNQAIGKKINDKSSEKSFKLYAVRSFASTFVGQFVDNILFAYIVSVHFFGWTHTQAWMCALTGSIFELLAEVVFSPIGYKASQRWKATGVGSKYLDATESTT